ncbi:hypothetical protein [Aquimarina sp. MMG016]|uniref:hypothetical protein n=1 Tax=Aquimarina sp. MMG016 TaxID=2822690 RepID=UPI001B3A4E01|nr:hypothetical protein [Aquimarina sp. MMG016]MBQ4818947.1 hypothetical protein [Aquimarina sp. MMG016]
MENDKDINSLFKMGGQPTTNILSINSKEVVRELLWLETGFTHCYGIDRLWLTNEWMPDPILLYICKESGGDIDVFERIFYNFLDPKKNINSLVTIEKAISLFTLMKNWIQSEKYDKLVNLIKDKPNSVYDHLIFDYVQKHLLQKDLIRIVESLNSDLPKNKLFIEICF